MTAERKTSAGGLAALLILSRIFTGAAGLPGDTAGYGMQRFTVTALSFLLAAVMYIPAILISRRCGEDFLSIIARRSRLLAIVTAVPLSVYLMVCSAETGLRSHYYTSSTLFDGAPSFWLFIFTGAALVFAVSKGIEAVSRTGTIVCAMLLLLLLLITISVFPSVKTDRLYPALIDESSSFMPEVIKEFSLNSEAVVFALLCGRVRSRAYRTIPLYLGISLALMMFMIFLYNTVFGRYLSMLELPFYTLSSLSDISVIHRINALDVIIWIMASVIKLAVYALAFGEAVISCGFTEKTARISSFVFALTSVGAAWYLTGAPELIGIPLAICGTGAPLVLLAVIAPSAALIIRTVDNKKEITEKCRE